MKLVTRIGSLTLAAVLSASMTAPAFAAGPREASARRMERGSETTVSARSETGTKRTAAEKETWTAQKEAVNTNHTALSEQMERNRELSEQLSSLREEKKGTLTAEERASLAEMTTQIQQLRQSNGSAREELAAQKEAGRGSMQSGDVQGAIHAFETTLELQQKQLDLQNSLNSLLEQQYNTWFDAISDSKGAEPETFPDIPSSSRTSEWESEHPPLSEATKKAIADYKKNPTEDSRQAVLDALNEAYDWVIENKQTKYAAYTEGMADSVNGWMKTIRAGGMPPFMSLTTTDDKGSERQAVADAVALYRQERTMENEAQVQQALEAYYNAFLAEQAYHIEETIALQESRTAASLEYFTSDRFQPQLRTESTVTQEDTLAEIICAYISVGAQFLPVNPEARVREREFNAAITAAQLAFLAAPTDENLSNLRAELAKAFETAYDVRVEEYAHAAASGSSGADALFDRMLDEGFLNQQFAELTEQRNLYGRIDRMVTYGGNTYGDWTPRMEEESQALSAALKEYEANPSETAKQNVMEQFYALYDSMLSAQKEHLDGLTLDGFIDAALSELTR